MKKPYSIRMRASRRGAHVSGAERIAEVGDVNDIVPQLLSRAFARSTEPDEVVVRCEKIAPHAMARLDSLDVVTLDCFDVPGCRSAAIRILESTGVPSSVAAAAVDLLASGASSSGRVMRGAAIMDIANGNRLEPDQERGVRASRFDWSYDAGAEAEHRLAAAGLNHYRTREALALATKIAHAPGTVAELCWSDDPEYTAGYVASRAAGYVRLPFMKRNSDPLGGRVIFFDAARGDLEQCIRYLQHAAVLIHTACKCLGPMSAEEYFDVRKRT